MSQRAIPCVLMRGGTSRGPFFLADDLPDDPELRDRVLLRVMGSPDARQIDGLGGATSVTSKVAIVSPSSFPQVDVDYLFAQVDITRSIVDIAPTCGNMLAAVGPFALERGLCSPGRPTTELVIRNVNTGSLIDATLQTPDGEVSYDGEQEIPGVPGTAAPIDLRFRQIVGSKTGAMFPTGALRDEIDGIEVSCVDIATPVVIAGADSFGKLGYESSAELDRDRDLLDRVQALRIEAGARMGLGDVTESVLPKFALIAPAKERGDFASRYFTPWQCHPTYAVSGAICVAAAAALPGTVANEAVPSDWRPAGLVRVEHPAGLAEVILDVDRCEGTLEVRSAGMVRTARKLMAGEVYVPHDVWPAPGS